MSNAITHQMTPIIQKPEPAALQHIENLERVTHRCTEEQKHIDASCYDRMGQRLNELGEAMPL